MLGEVVAYFALCQIKINFRLHNINHQAENEVACRVAHLTSCKTQLSLLIITGEIIRLRMKRPVMRLRIWPGAKQT